MGVVDVPRQDLAVHADLAHAARDQLRILRPEVEDQDSMGVDVRRPQRQLDATLS
jgi:hypothetical protein